MDGHHEHSRRLQRKTIPFILLSVIMMPLGNVLLGKGMKRVGALHSFRPSDLVPFIERAFTSPWLWLAIACFLGFFVSYMLLLTWADYSYVQPASAFSNATVAILSYLVLHEVVSLKRWAGIAVICLGVFIVGRSSPSSAPAPTAAGKA